jgi:hypothetical protein
METWPAKRAASENNTSNRQVKASSVGHSCGLQHQHYLIYLMEDDDSRGGRFFFFYAFIHGKKSL